MCSTDAVNVDNLSRMVINSNEVCTNVDAPIIKNSEVIDSVDFELDRLVTEDVEIVHTSECLDVRLEVSLSMVESVSEDLKLNECLGNFAVEAQVLLLSDDGYSRDVSELNMNVVSDMVMGDASQIVHDCSKALLSMDSVMTTVVCENVAQTNFCKESSSNVALMYMNVDCGERVIVVRTVVLLQHCGQMTNGLNDVFTQVVTIMPCTPVLPKVVVRGPVPVREPSVDGPQRESRNW